MSAEARALPQNQEAEQAVLGSVLLSPDLLDDLDLEPGDFFREAHGNLWRLMRAMREDGDLVSLLTLLPRLQRDPDRYGGLGYVSGLADDTPSMENAEVYATLVRECARKRALIINLLGVVERVYTEDESFEDLASAAEMAANVGAAGPGSTWVASADDVSSALGLALADRSTREDAAWTGLPSLDDIMGGLRRKELVIVAGRPGSGKTTLADAMAVNLASEGVPVGILSLEMSREQLATRRLCAMARVSQTHIERGTLTTEHRRALQHAARRLAKLPVYVDDEPAMPVDRIRRKIRRLQRDVPGLRAVFIDFFGLIKGGKGDKRWEQASENAKALQQLAKELDLTIVLLSQLGRQVEQRGDKRPLLSDLRETGSLEEAADVVLFCYREDYYNRSTKARGLMEIIVAKNRSGSVGTANVYFTAEYTRVDPLERL